MIRRESSFTIRRRDLLAALLGGSLVVAGAISQRLSLDPAPQARAISQFARGEAAARSTVDSAGSRYLPLTTTYTPASTTLAASTTRRAARPRRLPPVTPRVADRGLALPAVPDKPLLLPPLTAPRIPNPIEQSDAEGIGSNPRVERLPQLVRTQQGIEVLPNPGIEPKPQGADSKGTDAKGADSKGASGQTAASAGPAKTAPSADAAAGGATANASKPLTDPSAGAAKPSSPAGSAASPGGTKVDEKGSGDAAAGKGSAGDAATKGVVKVEPQSPSDQEKRQAAGGSGAQAKGSMTEERVQPMRDLPDPMTPLPGYGETFPPIPSGPVVDLPLIRRDGDGDGGTCDDAPPLQIWRGGYLKDPLRTFPIRLPNP